MITTYYTYTWFEESEDIPWFQELPPGETPLSELPGEIPGVDTITYIYSVLNLVQPIMTYICKILRSYISHPAPLSLT